MSEQNKPDWLDDTKALTDFEIQSQKDELLKKLNEGISLTTQLAATHAEIERLKGECQIWDYTNGVAQDRITEMQGWVDARNALIAQQHEALICVDKHIPLDAMPNGSGLRDRVHEAIAAHDKLMGGK